MKEFKGKAIYNPIGKAGEYSYWACNFYNGCSNGCTYCYCKKGRSKHIFGGDKPTLKKRFKDEEHALEVFEKELQQNLPELQEHGLFFSFTTDPMLPETWLATISAMNACHCDNVPVKILTKRVEWVDRFIAARAKYQSHGRSHKLTAFGFTLTGHDELEPNASTNDERIEAMRKLHKAGFKTFASIEPIIDLDSSRDMIGKTLGFCDLYKIGLLSGKKYNKQELIDFINWNLSGQSVYESKARFYFKDSLLKQAGIQRSELPFNCVGRDYSLFN